MKSLTLLAALGLSALAPTVRAAPSQLSEAARILVAVETERDVPLAVTRLVRLGEPGVDQMLHEVGEAPELHRRVLLDALAELPSDTVVQHAFAALETELPAKVQPAEVYTVLGAIGTRRDLKRMLTVGEELDVGRPVQEAVGQVLGRDRSGFATLRVLWKELPEAARTKVVRAAGMVPGPDALEFLAELLARPLGCEGQILAQMGRACEGVERELALEVAGAVHPMLASEHEGIVKSVALLLGKLEDAQAVPDLIWLLGHDSRGLTQNAHWALARITGLQLPMDRDIWEAWFVEEDTWWGNHSARAFAELSSSDPTVAAQAVREVSSHTLDRHRLAYELVAALDHPHATVRRLGCEALRRVGSGDAVPTLIDLLEDPSTMVADAAWASLRALTGQDLPNDPEAWRSTREAGLL